MQRLPIRLPPNYNLVIFKDDGRGDIFPIQLGSISGTPCLLMQEIMKMWFQVNSNGSGHLQTLYWLDLLVR